MSISKLIYQDLPQFISRIRNLATTGTVRSRGLSFKIITDNWITKYRSRSFNDKEPEMLDWLDKNLMDGDVFFDVGANVGVYSIYAALRNPHTTVCAFEPEYSNLNQLKQNIIINKLSASIKPYSIALGEKTDISYLHIQDYTAGSALHTVSKDQLIKTQTGNDVVWKEGIATFTTDEFCKMTGISPNMVKIDVDGNEVEILKGGKQVFSNSECRTIYIEVDSMQTECGRILNEYGFTPVRTYTFQYGRFENQIWVRN